LCLRAGSLALLFRGTLPLVHDLAVVRNVSVVVDPRIMRSVQAIVEWSSPVLGNAPELGRGGYRLSPEADLPVKSVSGAAGLKAGSRPGTGAHPYDAHGVSATLEAVPMCECAFT
jgi:hypothetical protein